MLTRVQRVRPGTMVGSTIVIDGRSHLVLHLLPPKHDGAAAARVTAHPECRLCEAPLKHDLDGWTCPACGDHPDRAALAAWAREHLQDGARAGKARRDRGSRGRQVARGAPGAAAVLLRAAADGGALSRSVLLDTVTGAERRALASALRGDGERPLPPERCREAAAELANIGGAPYPVTRPPAWWRTAFVRPDRQSYLPPPLWRGAAQRCPDGGAHTWTPEAATGHPRDPAGREHRATCQRCGLQRLRRDGGSGVDGAGPGVHFERPASMRPARNQDCTPEPPPC